MRSFTLRGTWSLLALALVASSALAKNNDQTANQWQMIQLQAASNLAVSVGKHVLAARAAIDNNDWTVARDELVKADTIVEVMEEQAATPSAKARIAFADQSLSYETPQRVEQGLVPIYTELDVITDKENNKKAKKHLEKAQKHLKKGDREAARAELKEIDKLIVAYEIVVPTQEVRANLQKAVTAVEQKNGAQAKQALDAARASVYDDVIAALDKEGKRTAGAGTTRTAE